MTPELTRGSKLKTEGSQWHGPSIHLQSEESVGCSCRPWPGANTVRHGQKILSELFFFFFSILLGCPTAWMISTMPLERQFAFLSPQTQMCISCRHLHKCTQRNVSPNIRALHEPFKLRHKINCQSSEKEN